MPIGEKDIQGNTLRLGGKNVRIWELSNGQFLFRFTDRKEVFVAKTEEDALKWYNQIEDSNHFAFPKLPLPRIDSRVEKEGDELPVLPEGAHFLGKFESQSTPGMFHYVVQYKDNTIRCSCWPFVLNKTCNHYRFTKNVLETVSVAALTENPIIVRYEKDES